MQLSLEFIIFLPYIFANCFHLFLQPFSSLKISMITISTNSNNLPIRSTLSSSAHILAMIPQVLSQKYNPGVKNPCIKSNTSQELQIFSNPSKLSPKIACNTSCAIQCHISLEKTNPTETAMLGLKCKAKSNTKNSSSCKKLRNSKNNKSS